jgi:hypothetical protein
MKIMGKSNVSESTANVAAEAVEVKTMMLPKIRTES